MEYVYNNCIFLLIFVISLFTTIPTMTKSWTIPDVKAKLFIKYDQEKIPIFFGNTTDYFKILDKDDATILIGARNAVYNVSLNGLIENQKSRITWESSEAHRQLCGLKGKQESVDCQNYIRVFVRLDDTHLFICGTNSYKPQCRKYLVNSDGTIENEGENEAQGICPYSPTHNSTYIYTDGQLYTATVADFSGADPLIYRKTQRTEQYDLKQLNQPAFVSSLERNGYVFFFFREIAMEYMNCGKAIYSRVARVCKNDRGGPHVANDRWTSFLKTRLNCSVPGEYPFYFDEIQATSKIIDGLYDEGKNAVIYAVFTTSQNAIGGSAVCAFKVNDILDSFEGRFKEQKDINSNWMPVQPDKVPEPRPGKCVDDSRTLPSYTVNFVKTHALMETSVPAMFKRPLLTRVSQHYRFTSITVDPQIESMSGNRYDVIFVGTDDGKVIKFVNVPKLNGTGGLDDGDFDTNIISEIQALPLGKQVKELTVSKRTSSLIVVGNGHIVSIPLFHCQKITLCRDCVHLQDPYCVWDTKNHECNAISSASRTSGDHFIQNLEGDGAEQCKKHGDDGSANSVEQPPTVIQSTHGTVSSIGRAPHQSTYYDNEIQMTSIDGGELTNAINSNFPSSDPISKGHQLGGDADDQLNLSTISWVSLSLIFIVLGVFIGFFVSRYSQKHQPYHNENCNQLNWHNSSAAAKNRHIRDKDINLLMNATQFSPQPCNNKIDNLEHEFGIGIKDRSHECKNSNESLEKEVPVKTAPPTANTTGTLQKVKKTYI